MQKYFFIINYLLIIGFGVLNYSKIKDSLPLKLFLYFLIYSFFTEVAGTYFAFNLKTNTAVIYNSWNLMNYLFFTYFFLDRIKSSLKRKIVFSSGLLFVFLFLLTSFFFKNYLTQVFIENFVLGKVLMIVWVLIYFSELLKNDEVFKTTRSMYFWISMGVMMYAIGFIPVLLIAEFISFGGIFRKITFALNIIMGLCFIIGFVVSKKEYNI